MSIVRTVGVSDQKRDVPEEMQRIMRDNSRALDEMLSKVRREPLSGRLAFYLPRIED
jgi:hypothetical protein